MSDKNKEEEKISDSDVAVVRSFSRFSLVVNWQKIINYIGSFVIVVAASAGVVIWVMFFTNKSHNNSNSINTSLQTTLQKRLSYDISSGNSQLTITNANKLIQGKLTNKFTFSNNLLAEYYMDAGASYSNLKEYSKAIVYYQDATKYDSALTMAALEGEVIAEYDTGERQQLIPLLSQLEKMSESIHDPEAPTAAQYQNDIQAIQNNQEVNL